MFRPHLLIPGRVLACVLFALFFLGMFSATCQAIPPTGPPISSAAEVDYPPFSFVDAAGQPDGFSVELLRESLQAMGRGVSFATGTWPEVRGLLERGEVQALPLVGRTPEREEVFDFTFPYMTLHGAIVVRQDATDIQGLVDLEGKRVAVMQGDNAEEFLRRKERGMDIHTTPTFVDALHGVSQGRYDAVVTQRLVALRLLQETGLTNLRIVKKPVMDFRQDFCFAVQEGDRETLALLNEGLALVMADGTYRHLHAKWFAALELPAHRRIVVGGDHNYPPFEFLDENGLPAGYNVDLTRAIAREMGLDIEIRLMPWAEVLQALEKGTIDAVQGMFYSPERDLRFDFTPAHSVNHCVAVVRRGEGPPPSTLAGLSGKRIVLQQGDIMHDFVRENRLGNQVTGVDAQEDALRGLYEGRHDVALVSRLTALHLINANGWDSLVVARTPLLSPDYCYAVSDTHKALLAQFGEGLRVVEETGEYRRIREKWMGVYEDFPLDPATVARYVALVVLPLLLLLLAILFWSWSLRRQVARRTAELRRSEQQFRSLVEGAPDAVFVQTDQCFAYLNEAALRLFGAPSKEQLLGMPVMDRFHPDLRQAIQERIHLLFVEKKPVPAMEQTYLRLDGSEVPVEVSAVPLTYNGREGALVFARDITERKQAEHDLRESNQLLSAFIRHSPVYAFIKEVTPTESRVIRASENYQDMIGVPGSQMAGKTMQELFPPEFAAKITADDWAVVSKGEILHLEEEFDGRHFTTIKFPIFLGGKNLLAGYTIDVTEQRKAQAEQETLAAQLVQAQKMEAVGRLAGGVAHDFNNMLSVINGYAELVLAELSPDAPQRPKIQEILNAGRQSAGLVRQLLAFARKQTIAPKVLDLNEAVTGLLKMLGRLIGEDIDLAWMPAHGLWKVKMDPSQLDQILANLAVNARDAITGVGRVTIETENVVFDQAYCDRHADCITGEYVLLAFSDDGCGMDQETQERLFEPFFTTKESGKGTGLGLSTVYGIVKQNDGFINVYSEPGKGSTFRIYLPRHKEENGGDEPQSAPVETPTGTETVLIVEDKPAVLALCREQVQSLGYTVLAAGSPGEAIKLAREHPGEIHLLLTDVVMPEMSGRELLERIKPLRPEIRCLFMSGYTANVIAHHGVLEEGINFIEKPFTRHPLALKLRQALSGS
ncbi:MAG: transporter substrate-binding domain-containing protein [Desulfohalobiaceae bacterium]